MNRNSSELGPVSTFSGIGASIFFASSSILSCSFRSSSLFARLSSRISFADLNLAVRRSTFSDIMALTPSSDLLLRASSRKFIFSLRSQFSFIKRSMVLLCSLRVRLLPAREAEAVGAPFLFSGDCCLCLSRYSRAIVAGTSISRTCCAITVSVGVLMFLLITVGVCGNVRSSPSVFKVSSPALSSSSSKVCRSLSVGLILSSRSLRSEMPDAILPRLMVLETFEGLLLREPWGTEPPDCKAKSAPTVTSLPLSVVVVVCEE